MLHRTELRDVTEVARMLAWQGSNDSRGKAAIGTTMSRKTWFVARVS